MPHSTSPIGTDIQDVGYGLPRIPFLRRWVNRSRYANLSYIPLAIFVYALSYIFYAVDRLFRMGVAHTKVGPL
jgi:hypothetical protein